MTRAEQRLLNLKKWASPSPISSDPSVANQGYDDESIADRMIRGEPHPYDPDMERISRFVREQLRPHVQYYSGWLVSAAIGISVIAAIISLFYLAFVKETTASLEIADKQWSYEVDLEEMFTYRDQGEFPPGDARILDSWLETEWRNEVVDYIEGPVTCSLEVDGDWIVEVCTQGPSTPVYGLVPHDVRIYDYKYDRWEVVETFVTASLYGDERACPFVMAGLRQRVAPCDREHWLVLVGEERSDDHYGVDEALFDELAVGDDVIFTYNGFGREKDVDWFPDD